MHRNIFEDMIDKGVRYLISILFAVTVMSCTPRRVPAPLPEAPPVLEQPQSTRQSQAPEPPPQREMVDSDLPTIQFTIQVGAFSTTDRAAAYAGSLLKRGLDAYYFIDADGLCKVRFEHFKTREAAAIRASELHRLGWIDAFYIVHPEVGGTPEKASPGRQLSLRSNIVRTANRFIGTNYRWGGESTRRGFDCSGLTMTVYRLNGLELPRSSRSQYRAGKPIKRSALLSGDLVFFATDGKRRVSHVGIYCGDGQFIHAPGQGKQIRTSSLSNGYFNRKYIGARRYF